MQAYILLQDPLCRGAYTDAIVNTIAHSFRLYVHMYIYIIYLRICTHTQNLHTHTHTHTHTCTYICTYIYICACTHTHILHRTRGAEVRTSMQSWHLCTTFFVLTRHQSRPGHGYEKKGGGRSGVWLAVSSFSFSV